jgi:hypothetical protein
LLGDFQGVVTLDAEIPDGTLKFGTAEEKPDRAAIPGPPGERAGTMRS